MSFCNLHTHSVKSDGVYSQLDVAKMAIEHGIQVLSFTDHNILSTKEELDAIEKQLDHRIKLVTGVEMSARYKPRGQEAIEVHVLVLMYDPARTTLQQVAEYNRSLDKSGRARAMLKRLRDECAIDLGTYEDICAAEKEVGHVGRAAVGRALVRGGWCATFEEAMDRYLGDYGERLAWVPSQIPYASLEEVVLRAIASKGLPVLAHPLSYRLGEAELEELVRCFSSLTRTAPAGIECLYSPYCEADRKKLAELGARYGLLPSAGSDFHGNDRRSMTAEFPVEIYEALERAHSAALQERNDMTSSPEGN